MTPEQRNRLQALLDPMRTMARRAPTQNEYHRRFNVIDELKELLASPATSPVCVGADGEAWLAIAEKAAEGHDKPGIVRMPSMAAVLSGMPPEHKED
jgi:hypothetical protein